MEQVTGIEPVTDPWQGSILPLNYTCKSIFAKKYFNIITKKRRKVNSNKAKKS